MVWLDGVCRPASVVRRPPSQDRNILAIFEMKAAAN